MNFRVGPAENHKGCKTGEIEGRTRALSKKKGNMRKGPAAAPPIPDLMARKNEKKGPPGDKNEVTKGP